MTAKQYLKGIRQLDNRIRRRRKSLDDLQRSRTWIRGLSAEGDRVMTSSDGQGFTKEAERIVDLERQIRQAVVTLAERREKVIHQIEGLPNETHVEILYMLYVDYEHYPDLMSVSLALDRSYDYIRHLHGYALSEFAKKYLSDNTK